MRILTFLLLEILLSPLSLFSFGLIQLWAIATSQHQKTSLTALAPLAFRWLLHIQGIRPDPATQQLVNNLPQLNNALLWGSIGPTLFAANVTGYTPDFLNAAPAGKETINNMIHTRTLFFDKAIARNLIAAKQVVLLGAGFDTRLLKFCLGQGRALFEIDQLSTQTAKIRALKKSGADLSEIKFVPVNFNTEDWASKLQQAGFKANETTFFLWEGVTYYLTESVVTQTLQKVDGISGEGSAIAFDVFSSSFVAARHEWQWIQPVTAMLNAVGEPFRFGMDLSGELSKEKAIAPLIQGTNFHVQAFQQMGNSINRPFSGLIELRKG